MLSYFCTGWTVEGVLKKMNIEHRMSNIRAAQALAPRGMLNGKRWRNRHMTWKKGCSSIRYEYQNGCKETEIAVECSVLDIRFSFDVGRSTLDVRCSSFKTIPYGINVTCERLQNNLALMPITPLLHYSVDGYPPSLYMATTPAQRFLSLVWTR